MPVAYKEKEVCWSWLLALKDMEHIHNSIIAGDINAILCNRETRGGDITRDLFRERFTNVYLGAEIEIGEEGSQRMG